MLLMDDCESSIPRNLWSIYYDLLVDVSMFETIHEQSQKLVDLTESNKKWATSKYGDYLRIVNTETINILRRYWAQYCNPKNASNEFFLSFKSALKRTYSRYHKNNPSCDFLRACGLNCQLVETQDFYYGKQFWQQGTIQKSSTQTHCNPLFAYSEGSGSHFAVHEYTSPYHGFHLGMGLSKLTLRIAILSGPIITRRHSQSIGGNSEHSISALVQIISKLGAQFRVQDHVANQVCGCRCHGHMHWTKSTPQPKSWHNRQLL